MIRNSMDMIHGESHFTFIGMHLLSHFCDHISEFGNIPMYSTEIGELAHARQIKQGWRQSNKNNAAGQMVYSYSCQLAIRIRLVNLQSLQNHRADLSPDVLKHLDRTATTVSLPIISRRNLKRRRGDVSNIVTCVHVPVTVHRSGQCRISYV